MDFYLMQISTSLTTTTAFPKKILTTMSAQVNDLPEQKPIVCLGKKGMSLNLWENPSLRRRLWRKSAYKFK